VTARRSTRRAAPAAPTFGTHEAVTRYGRHLGAVVDVMGAWTPVCTHKACYRRLVARDDREEAKDALRHHWGARHSRATK
jgi:hypothetical protein